MDELSPGRGGIPSDPPAGGKAGSPESGDPVAGIGGIPGSLESGGRPEEGADISFVKGGRVPMSPGVELSLPKGGIAEGDPISPGIGGISPEAGVPLSVGNIGIFKPLDGVPLSGSAGRAPPVEPSLGKGGRPVPPGVCDEVFSEGSGGRGDWPDDLPVFQEADPNCRFVAN